MMLSFFGTLPIQGTEIAAKWDNLYIFLTLLSVFFFVLVVGGMVYFAYKYRERPGHKATYIEGNVPLEVVWTIIPTIILLIVFAWGYFVYSKMVTAPADALEIKVVGKQWSWIFQYDDGRTFNNEVFVPVGKPVKFIMTSEDVLHSFFIPNFRVKQDVVPGMYTSIWFEAKVVGDHQAYCAEYCGAAHSGMLAMVKALAPADWEKFQLGKNPTGGVLSLVDQGKKLSQTRGCIACHSADGNAGIGPSYKGLFGKKETMTDGTEVEVNEAYIRESIEKPMAKIVKNFMPVMPPQPPFNEQEFNALIAYLKSLK